MNFCICGKSVEECIRTVDTELDEALVCECSIAIGLHCMQDAENVGYQWTRFCLAVDNMLQQPEGTLSGKLRKDLRRRKLRCSPTRYLMELETKVIEVVRNENRVFVEARN